MKIVVFGLGYVGFTAACCLVKSGHDVVGVEVNEQKVSTIRAGQSPIVEPDVQDLLTDALAKGALTVDVKAGVHLADADLAMVCVGTPSQPDGNHNMGYVVQVTQQIADAVGERAAPPLRVTYRSTIRPGTMEELIAPIFQRRLGVAWRDAVCLIYNPEFLREGSAVKDFFHPPKIVVGTEDGGPDAVIDALNEGLPAPSFSVRFREAEFTKFVDNTWHAVKVAFANEIGRVCLNAGLSAADIHKIFVADTKLNISQLYLRPGGAFGGSCLPKDVRALQHLASDLGCNTQLIDAILRSNEAHKHRLFEHAVEGLVAGARVLLAGLAFKPGTDDLRESPSVDLARKLLRAGYRVDIFDPAIDGDMLVGANLGYAFSQLPQLQRLLVNAAKARETHYDRVIATNATVKLLNLPPNTNVRDISALS